MQKYDPEFDLEDLTDEAEEIFKEFYCNFLTGNTEYLDMVCGQTAGALVKAHCEVRQKEGWKFKYDELLSCGPTFFQGALISEKLPQFIFHIEVQEFDEKINEVSGDPYMGTGEEGSTPGGSGRLMQNTYRMVLTIHEEPNIEVTGHYWEIIEFYKIGEVAMIA